MQFALLLLLLVASVSSHVTESHCTDDSLLHDFPRRLRSATINVVIPPDDSAPFVTRSDYGVPYGFDIDLMNLISFLYRKPFQYQYESSTVSTISIVQSNVNTIAIGASTITPELTRSVDFAQFFKTGSSFLVKSSYGGTITGLNSLCGKNVAVISGTIQVDDLNRQNTQCRFNRITIKEYASNAEALNALSNGVVEVFVADEALLKALVVISNNAFKIVGRTYNVLPYGILCNKNNRELCCALVNAINYLIKEGIYEQLLQRYSFSCAYGVCPSRINLEGPTCSSRCTPGRWECKKYLH
ncbi:unnamed protein product [Rotaria sp. Silwood2]|nr:unnamed protein product [Rotaria sp. Silwood2]CAF3168586.1 unnamed protein product [Rotaria sp. Silwood2]CAF3430820.1 unnamed protein product [Rotaria sp. Silwood2]CAF4492659.1 unnamed protein product [Rotaria sp. Silwood2]CAF4517185.1 unnamed protein product [Rotaria sp. Silwood2]